MNKSNSNTSGDDDDEFMMMTNKEQQLTTTKLNEKMKSSNHDDVIKNKTSYTSTHRSSPHSATSLHLSTDAALACDATASKQSGTYSVPAQNAHLTEQSAPDSIFLCFPANDMSAPEHAATCVQWISDVIVV